jgi:hypothetical protein|tara:strand:+ start:232 stop:1032 length:801 start_codon:yes stop_codon:yes gene_type:complete
MNVSSDWYQFQEEICAYFESIGASAKTNITVQGVRTSHDIDVLVKTKFLGEDLTWIVEAKKWKKRVNKLQILGLRTIADDIGADKAFIISEAGFQKGAYEAAEKTNVKLKTFAELKLDTKELVEADIIKTFKKRLEILEIKYWSHSKKTRKDYDLREELWEFPIRYSGQLLLKTAHEALIEAENKRYPINLETYLQEKQGDLIAHNFQQLSNWLNVNLNHMDEKIYRAEARMIENGDFNPDIRFKNDNEMSTVEMMAKAIATARNR